MVYWYAGASCWGSGPGLCAHSAVIDGPPERAEGDPEARRLQEPALRAFASPA